jgi:hypothetical protein
VGEKNSSLNHAYPAGEGEGQAGPAAEERRAVRSFPSLDSLSRVGKFFGNSPGDKGAAAICRVFPRVRERLTLLRRRLRRRAATVSSLARSLARVTFGQSLITFGKIEISPGIGRERISSACTSSLQTPAAW